MSYGKKSDFEEKYSADNENSTMEKYIYRQYYKYQAPFETSWFTANNKFIDMLYEKPLFGKIDQKGNAVYPLNESTLKQIPSQGNPLFALDFVADAFTDFVGTLETEIGRSAFELPMGPVRSLAPYSAWSSADNLYQSHLDDVKKTFLEDHLRPHNNKIKNLQDFLNVFKRFVKDRCREFPLTFTNFIKSTMCPNSVSGLIISLSDESKASDEQKYSTYFAPGFELYRRAANEYGFYVDKNAPWQLCANISSFAMAGYMRNYQVSSQDFYKEYNIPVYLQEMHFLRELILDIYYAFHEENKFYQEKHICKKSKKLKRKTIYRKALNLDALRVNISDKYMYEIMIEIKSIEQVLEIFQGLNGEKVKKALVRRVIKEHDRHGRDKALRMINTFFRKQDNRINVVKGMAEERDYNILRDPFGFFGTKVTKIN